LPLKGGAKCFRPVETQTLSTLNRGLGEGAVQHILAKLGFGVGKEAKAGSVLIKTLVQTCLLVPAVLVVVDVMIGFGIGEVELICIVTVGTIPRRWDRNIGFAMTYLIRPDTNNVAFVAPWMSAHVGVLWYLPGCKGHLTISRMQLNKDMTEGPLCNAFDIGLPINRRAGERRSWELGERVQVDVVDDCIHGVRNDRCKGGGHQDRQGPILVSLHWFVEQGSDVVSAVVGGNTFCALVATCLPLGSTWSEKPCSQPGDMAGSTLASMYPMWDCI
jgi:hypothetical protein